MRGRRFAVGSRLTSFQALAILYVQFALFRRSKQMPDPNENTLTREEMRQWLEQEVRDLTKATELRLSDATEFVMAYALGKMTATEAMERLTRYGNRWGDSPIPGVYTDKNMTDDEIIRRLEEGKSEDATARRRIESILSERGSRSR
jgi:hypothetical protein